MIKGYIVMDKMKNNVSEEGIFIPHMYYTIGIKNKDSDSIIFGFLANDKITEDGFEGEYYIEPMHKYTYSESHSVKFLNKPVAERYLSLLLEFNYIKNIADKYNLEVMGYCPGMLVYPLIITKEEINDIIKKHPDYDISLSYIFDRDILTRLQDAIWYNAEHADEKPMYYKVYQQIVYNASIDAFIYSSTFIIKRYKPSLAKVVIKRTGCKMIPIEINKVYTKDNI